MGTTPLVEVEARLGDGERVADVLVQWPVKRVAFEIQYVALSFAAWQERHEWYVRTGIKNAWLWGTLATTSSKALDATEEAPSLFKLGDVQRAVIQVGERALYWVNPLTEQIATGYVRRPHAAGPA